MAITGTGTQADPYIVSTWDEIVEKIAETNAYVKCAPGLVFDMNEMFPDEAPGLTFHCLEFDGNGVVIKNGRYNDTIIKANSATPDYGDSASIAIRGINVLNFLLQGTGHMISTGSPDYSYYNGIPFTCYDCVFTGVSSSSGAIIKRIRYVWSQDHNFYRCGFNVEAKNGQNFVGGTAQNWSMMYFHDCHIIFNGDHLATTDCYGSFRMQNSLLQGDLGSQAYICDSHDSIIDADCESIVYSQYDTYSNVLYNSERAQLTNVPSGIFTPMTAAELRDASAIAATGFPIGVST